ncbi:EF-TU receptor [Prunus dulcis]|uniref:EF-TU receptor n=1 Tax=Prunus dulcis TaxID=3755 RepID=A0A4Y1RER0_PRUDU|nr:EF-TU receptor [Prunus dulcis]
MESARIARCSYGAVTVVIALFEHSKYADICHEMCLRFKELKVGSFELTYSLPEHPNCLLQSDMDVHLMLMCLSMLKTSFVDISVKDLLSSNNEDGNHGTSNHAAPNHTTYSHAVSNRAAPDHAASNDATSDHAAVDHGASNHATPGAPNHALSADAMSNHTTPNDATSNHAASSDAISNHAASSSCMLDSSAFDENEHLGTPDFMKARHFCLRVHTCKGAICEEKSKMMSSRIISSVLVDRIQEEPFIKPIDIVKDFKQNYGLDISYHTAWYAKNLAKSEVHGDESSSYSQLVWYRDALMSSNRGSHCVLECDPKTSRFRRLFICYGACIEGFRWCRPLLFIDVTGLESKHKGQLIGATGKNGNQGSFPFAFAIVDLENEENWSWFFENLAKVLTPQGRTITFISDHNKGLTEAVSNMFPTSHHAFCLQHLKQNLLSKYPSTYGKFFRDHIVDLFLKCAYAPTKAAFEVNMRNLKHEGGAPVMTFLEDLPKESWSYAYFKGNRYGEMCNNASESFNSWIFELRALPICQMVDGIRSKLKKMMAEWSRKAEQWCSVLCPMMERTLNERLMVGRNWNVSRCSASVYDVHAEICVKVDLANRLCSCHEWQIKGFPCVHALFAIQKDSSCIHEYTDDHFKSSYFRCSYAFSISPIPDIKNVMHEGSEDVIMPPLTKKRRGRPRTKMPKSVGEV